jgi:hypothetical protein
MSAFLLSLAPLLWLGLPLALLAPLLPGRGVLLPPAACSPPDQAATLKRGTESLPWPMLLSVFLLLLTVSVALYEPGGSSSSTLGPCDSRTTRPSARLRTTHS